MSDSEYLQWIHDRIVNVYGENENVDFLIRFRTIINEFLNKTKMIKIIVDSQELKDKILSELEYVLQSGDVDTTKASTLRHIYMNPDLIELNQKDMSKRYKITIPVGNLTEKEFISLGKMSKIFKDIKVEELNQNKDE